MKKLLFIVIPVLALVGCAPESKGQLPPPPAGSYTVVLDASTSNLTIDDSSKPITINLKALENESVTYIVEIGAPCYLKSVSKGSETLQEIIVKNGAYFKSVSNYQVSKIACDIFEGKGINYTVHNNADGSGNPLDRHESSLTPVYPEDSGAVYEYQIDSTGWRVKNDSNYKPAFYSVTIYFEIK